MAAAGDSTRGPYSKKWVSARWSPVETRASGAMLPNKNAPQFAESRSQTARGRVKSAIKRSASAICIKGVGIGPSIARQHDFVERQSDGSTAKTLQYPDGRPRRNRR